MPRAESILVSVGVPRCLVPQILQFCLLTNPSKWKCDQSENQIILGQVVINSVVAPGNNPTCILLSVIVMQVHFCGFQIGMQSADCIVLYTVFSLIILCCFVLYRILYPRVFFFNFKRKILTWSRIRTSNLQVSILVLYHLIYPVSMQGLVVCDPI